MEHERDEISTFQQWNALAAAQQTKSRQES